MGDQQIYKHFWGTRYDNSYILLMFYCNPAFLFQELVWRSYIAIFI